MKSNTVYLDHSATTYLLPEVKKAMMPFFETVYGNPGSFHAEGLNARRALQSARERVAKILNCRANEVIFTGSGTESINLAIKGVAEALKNNGKHIITSKIEHHAVLHTCKWLETQGFEVTYLDVDKYGQVNPKSLEKAIRKDTILASIMYANNEIGTLNSIKELAGICRKHSVLFHTDACQVANTQTLDVKELGADLLSLNGSKIYAPKGIGLLYVKSGTPIKPIIHGGHQEFGLRAGTENIAFITGFAKALEIADAEKEAESKRLKKLRDRLEIELINRIPESFVNGHPKERLPNILNITVLNVEGEALLLKLDKEGICASTGSACTSDSLEPSHVLLGIGLPYEAAHGSLRFSLGKNTSEDDIDKVIEVLPGIAEELRKLSPVKLRKEDVLK
ncbi:MAG: IscS subfamily cysteine desulfurase [Candidatus Woesearchaeota archaeon]